MDSKAAKSDRHYAFLSNQRDQYIKNLTRVGAELMHLNDGEYDIGMFVKQFVPSRNKVKNEVTKEFIDSQTFPPEKSPRNKKNSSADPETCVDSQLIDAIQAEFRKYEKDFRDSLKTSDSGSDGASIVEVEESQRVPTKERKSRQDKKKQDPPAGEVVDNDLTVSHVLNFGELSKIFVQKSRVDFVRSKTNKPCFEDDNLETIYIYRARNAE